jgi:glycosyltransferase involved in cell wall biosynthesis
LVSPKGFRILLKAFSEVRTVRMCRLVILGEGPERSALTDLASSLGISDDVALPGFDENPYRWMRRAAAFVLSSYHEGFPSVLLEAMACGVPVVSTDCPSGPDEILEGGRWGRLVPVEDASAMADAMIGAMDTTAPDVSTRLSLFAPKIIANKYLSVLLP